MRVRHRAFYTVSCWIQHTSTEVTLAQFETVVLRNLSCWKPGDDYECHDPVATVLEQFVLTHELFGEPRQNALFRKLAHGLDALESGDDDHHLLQLFLKLEFLKYSLLEQFFATHNLEHPF